MIDPRQVASQFQLADPIVDVPPLGRGLINDTFLIMTTGGEASWAVLQRINQQVFPEPRLIMENLRVLLDHVGAGADDGDGFRLPTIVSSETGEDFHWDGQGNFWRALGFIHGTHSFDTLSDRAQAEEVGRTLGRFHALVAELDTARLHDTLPGFHITPHYLRRLEQILAQRPLDDDPELNYCLRFIADRKEWAGVLEEAKQSGLLTIRPIHGDPKLNNILFHQETRRAVSLVDLDTVKPGLIHYDIGDCLRSCCHRGGETSASVEDVLFDVDIAQAILGRYFQETRRFLTRHDYAYLYDAIRLIPFELGVRFLTDHLEGDRYFKVGQAGENLRRAVRQLRLSESVERQEQPIRRLLSES